MKYLTCNSCKNLKPETEFYFNIFRKRYNKNCRNCEEIINKKCEEIKNKKC